MKIKRLVIENFKSIERIELIEPNPFTVFVGPNGSGKSNIFEALEFMDITWTSGSVTSERLFGGEDKFLRRNSEAGSVKFILDFGIYHFLLSKPNYGYDHYLINGPLHNEPYRSNANLQAQARLDRDQGGQILKNFSHLFCKNSALVKLPFKDDTRLSLDASNLELVLRRVLRDEVLRNEIFEWLELFVPEFKAVEIDERDELHWFEEYTTDYFTKDLISDGTYNILSLLTAVYQSDDKPQFLCIEEPENGLHPQVARELIDFFRIMCEERGHYIWLNTHSQSMISRLKPEEMVVVEKKQGKTQITQYQGRDFHGLRMDEALLMNVLGAGLPW